MEQTPTPFPQLKTATSSKKGLFIALGVALIILALGGGYYFFFFNKPAPVPTQEENVATSSASPSEPEETVEIGYVTAKAGLNLRSEPSTNSRIIILLPHGTEVKIVSDEEDWYLVESVTEGFVSKEFISETKPKNAIILKTFNTSGSPFNFLYPENYSIEFTKNKQTFQYEFSGNESTGGFKIEAEKGFSTIGNYALKNYNAQGESCGQLKFGTDTKECETELSIWF
jgi:hypothetical protein